MPYHSLPNIHEHPNTPGISDLDSKLRQLFPQIPHSEKAFDELYYTWSPRARWLVKHYVKDEAAVQELVQDLFVRIWVKKEQLASVEHPGAWIKKVTINICLNYIRDTRQEPKPSLPEDETFPVKDPDDILHAKDLEQIIRKGVDQLPTQQRLIYKMSKEQLLTRREIAGQLQISEHTVKNQLSSSLRFLQKYLAAHAGVRLPVILISLFS